MMVDRKSRTPKAFFARAVRRRTRFVMVVVTALVLGSLGAALSLNAHASTPPTSFPLWGTLDTQTNTAATEGQNGIMAMFEFNWASFEPAQGQFSASYLTTMRYELASYQAAGQQVTLGLGLENPPSWVFSLANSTYVDQNGDVSTEANFVFSAAVRTAAAQVTCPRSPRLPLSNFWAIRLTSGGDGEMLYPGGGTYWAFNKAALTGTGLPSGMTRNPDPTWKPGTAGLTRRRSPPGSTGTSAAWTT
jgi:hypothetical protein